MELNLDNKNKDFCKDAGIYIAKVFSHLYNVWSQDEAVLDLTFQLILVFYKISKA